MSTSARLRLSDVRAAFRLLGEVRELGADPQDWRPHLVLGLRRLLEAQVVISSEVYFRTSRAGTLRVIDIGWGCDADGQTWRIHNEQTDSPESYWLRSGGVVPEESSAAPGEEARLAVRPTRRVYGGTSFILSQCELPHIGAVDQLGLHRAFGDRHFTPAEHRLVRLFHIELARLWRQDALRRARDPQLGLPPRLAQTLRELLDGASEKQVALKLELSQHTIHNYVKALHQRFEVNSRGELLAKAGKIRATFLPQFSLDPPKTQ